MEINNLLPDEIENVLSNLIEKKLREVNLEEYIKKPIKDDVLDLLDTLCTVIYYPLENEGNNGFHITDMPFANGSTQNFVYINTAQTMEKQVFTAAHELGHIWCIDDIILDLNVIKKEDKNSRELIINRFAAMLLMPKNLFQIAWETECNNHFKKDGVLTIFNLFKIVVLLMEQFFAPMKAVVLRLFELNFIDIELAQFLLGNGDIPEKDIDAIVRKIISSLGLIQFQNPTYKKWIKGFEEILDKADKENLALKRKIESMRELFDLKDGTILSEINGEVTINK